MTVQGDIAVWVITPSGLGVARRLAAGLAGCKLWVSRSVEAADGGHGRFTRLKDAVARQFHRYPAHVFVTAAGIAVRVVAPLLESKTVDPAVVVVDDRAKHAISLVSGHIGGANALCRKVAGILEARAVITTATDLQNLPAVDVLAREKNLTIENSKAIKAVSMAVIRHAPVFLYDPLEQIAEDLHGVNLVAASSPNALPPPGHAGIVVDDRIHAPCERVLVLRPRSLIAGMGCRRNTSESILHRRLMAVLDRFALAPASLAGLATADIKADEPGLRRLAERLNLPLFFFTADQLNTVTAVPTPSETVEKHIGAKSVCEAAAILGSRRGQLIVPKQKSPETTVAVARTDSTSSASAPATLPTSPGGR